jgi:putative ABC transport system substrate-binding protein
VRRRKFIAITSGAVVALPLSTLAQSPTDVHRIGFLSSASSSAGAERLQAFKEGLRDLGYVEGQNLTIEYRWAEGKDDRLSALAAELVALKVDLIVTQGTLATIAARAASPTIPIVFAAAGDPLQAKLVASLGRPGGNVTGFAVLGAEMTAKRMEVLREAVPGVVRIAAVWNRSNPSSEPEWKETEGAAKALGIQLQSLEVTDPGSLASAFASLSRAGAQGIIVRQGGQITV